MSSIYANGLVLHMNEIALLQFMLNTQNGSNYVVTVAVAYDALKQMHAAIGQCLEQYETKLHQVQRDKAKAN